MDILKKYEDILKNSPTPIKAPFASDSGLIVAHMEGPYMFNSSECPTIFLSVLKAKEIIISSITGNYFLKVIPEKIFKIQH